MDYIVHGVAKSQTWLRDLHFHKFSIMHLTFVYFAFISSFFFFNFCVAFHCMGCICHILFTPPLLRDICQFLVIMNKCCYKYLHAGFSCLSGKYIGVEMLDLTVNICLLSEETAQLFSEVCVCVSVSVCARSLSHVWLFVAPSSVEFFRNGYWGLLPFLTPGNFPSPGIEPMFLVSIALAGRFFTTSTTWEETAQLFSTVPVPLCIYPSNVWEFQLFCILVRLPRWR